MYVCMYVYIYIYIYIDICIYIHIIIISWDPTLSSFYLDKRTI